MTLVVTKENFEKEVVKSDVPVLIDFWASWCMPCKMMAPVFDELSNEFEGKIKFVKINVENEQELANKFIVQGIPALILVKNGEEVGRISGFMPKSELKKEINKLLENV